MITIREYTEDDAECVGRLIADTYTQFNLAYLSAEELKSGLGPFQHAWSLGKAHQEEIARMIRSEWVFVAEDGVRSLEFYVAEKSVWQVCLSGATITAKALAESL
jgi:hypothetical protein